MEDISSRKILQSLLQQDIHYSSEKKNMAADETSEKLHFQQIGY